MKKRFVWILFLLLSIMLILPNPVLAIGNYGVDLNSSSYSNRFSWGQCTWYCFGRTNEKMGLVLPCRGNAKDWLNEAANAGFATGNEARANSILVSPDGYWNGTRVGHVMFVENVQDGVAYITEGKYGGDYHEDTINLSTGKRGSNPYGNSVNVTGYIYLWPTVSTNASTYSVGDTIYFSFYAAGAASLHLYIYKGSELFFEGQFQPNDTYSRTAYPAGSYSYYIYAHYDNGDVKTASQFFQVQQPTKLTVNPNGGTWNGSSSAQEFTLQSGGAKQINDPVREGYEFAGWGISGSGKMSPQSYNYPYGVPIYADNTFYNSIQVYNINENGAVTHTKVAKDASCPSSADKMIKITTSGSARPGLGGFMQYTQASGHGIYYHVITAKVPVGYSLNHASNNIGYQGTREWITDNKGTGEWETYIYKVQCGYSGSIETFGHVYLTSDTNSDASITWYLGCSNIYDAYSVVNGKNTDPCFTASQPLSVYNNLENGTVKLDHMAKTADTPTTSKYFVRVSTNGSASPGLGGVYFQVDSKSNGVFYQTLVAKIPVGYTLERASNRCGDNYTVDWLTTQEGTGDWETYICRTNCGSTGTFQTLGFWYLKPKNGQTSVTWYICYANVFDSTPAFTAGSSDAVLTAQWKNSATVTEVQLDLTKLSIIVDNTATLTATVLPAEVNNKTVVWTSDTPGVATVDSSGKVTAVAPGTATITASAGGKSTTCVVTVTPKLSYSIGELRISSASGTPLTSIPTGELLVTIPITKLTEGGDGLVFLAAYGTNGQYKGLMYVGVKDLAAGSTVEISLPVDNTKGEIAQIKAYPVASFRNLVPVGNASVFPAS